MKALYNVLIVLDCYNKAGNILDKKKIVKITQLISNILFPNDKRGAYNWKLDSILIN